MITANVKSSLNTSDYAIKIKQSDEKSNRYVPEYNLKNKIKLVLPYCQQVVNLTR